MQQLCILLVAIATTFLYTLNYMEKTESVDSWATLLKTFTRLHERMEEEVKAKGLPCLEVYDVLWTLEQSPSQRLRFHDLAEKIYLSRYNITRIIQRLEKEGWIIRCQCPTDKRGLYAELTTEGKKMRKKIWGCYGQLIKELYSNKLSQSEHRMLIEMLHKVKVTGDTDTLEDK